MFSMITSEQISQGCKQLSSRRIEFESPIQPLQEPNGIHEGTFSEPRDFRPFLVKGFCLRRDPIAAEKAY